MYQGPEARPLIASSTLDALLPTAKPIVVRRSRSLVQAEKAIALAPEAAYLLFLAWLVLMVTIGGAFHLLNRRVDDLSLSLPSPETVLLPDGIDPAVNFGCYPRSGPAPLNISCADFTPGPIQARHWDFGDGSEGYGLVTTHTYSVAGEYTVSLVVNSPDAGVSKGWRKSYLVVAPKPPVGAADDE